MSEEGNAPETITPIVSENGKVARLNRVKIRC